MVARCSKSINAESTVNVEDYNEKCDCDDVNGINEEMAKLLKELNKLNEHTEKLTQKMETIEDRINMGNVEVD